INNIQKPILTFFMRLVSNHAVWSGIRVPVVQRGLFSERERCTGCRFLPETLIMSVKAALPERFLENP
nr:hypothetical protein [Desulfobacterales bacterium]